MKDAMRQHITSLLMIGICLTSSLAAEDVNIPQRNLFVHNCEKLSLFHNKEGFHVRKGTQIIPVENHNVEKKLRNLSQKAVKSFVANRYKLGVKRLSDGNYKVETMGNLRGGGPVFGSIGYWGTKFIAYGTAMAGALYTLPAAGVTGAIAGATSTLATNGAVLGTSVVANTIIGGGLGAEAAIVTTGTLATAGAEVVAIVEGTAAAVGTALLACPFLP